MTKYFNQILTSWFWLIVLTLLSVAIGFYFQTGGIAKLVFISVVMLIIVLKGQQIIDIFMELKHAPRTWRLLLMSYVVLIPAIISVIYLL